MPDEWIWIPNWDGKEGFQHYKERDPIWIKNYTRLLSHDAYLGLTLHRRGILHGIWLAYASSPPVRSERAPSVPRADAERAPSVPRQLRGDTLTLTRRLGQRVTRADLEALSDAGFIEIVASDELAARYPSRAPAHSQEVEKEVEELPPTEVSSSSTRSEETPTPRSAGGRAALDTQEDIPMPAPPTFPCPHCDHVAPTWGDLQEHLAHVDPRVHIHEGVR